MKKIVLFLLLFLLTASSIASCEKEPEANSKTDSQASHITYWQKYDPDIKNFVIQAGSGAENGISRFAEIEFATNEEAKSGVINDAVVRRTDYLEENFGITIEVVHSNASDRMEMLRQTIQSGDNPYHVVANTPLSMAAMMNEGVLHDLKKIKTMDLDRDYYDQTIVEDLSLGNALYFISSDAILSDKMATWTMYYNKDLIEQYNLEHPYDLVRSGEWTIDKMHEMARAVSDYNQGIANPTIEDGLFGYIGQTYDALLFMEGFGQRMFSKDEYDLPIADYENAITYSKFDKLFNLFKDKSTTIIAELDIQGDYSVIYPAMQKGFYEGRGLFHADSIAVSFDIAEQADASFSFGVLPLPKYDTSQANYSTSATTYWTIVMAIPNNWEKEEAEDIGYFIDILSYYGSEYLMPAFYEISLYQQKAETAEDEEILRMVFENRVWDHATVYNFGESMGFYTSALFNDSNQIASIFEQNRTVVNTAIDLMRAKFE